MKTSIKKLIAAISFGAAALSVMAEPVVHSATGQLPKGTPVVIDDFEDGNYWIYASDDWEQWDDGHKWSIGADLSKKWKSNGKYSLDCQMEKSTYGTVQAGVWYTEGEYDLSQFNYIVMDICIPDPNIYFGLMLATQTSSWVWNQAAEYYWLEQGEHTIVYDISSWPLEEKQGVVRFMLMHANEMSQEGHFYLDNVRGYR